MAEESTPPTSPPHIPGPKGGSSDSCGTLLAACSCIGCFLAVILFVLALAIGLAVGKVAGFADRWFGSFGQCQKVPENIQQVIIPAAEKYGVRPELLAAIFAAENGVITKGPHYNGGWPKNLNGPWETSNKGAQGPFQFMPGTWVGHAQDGDGDGKKDIQNIWDAAYAAAHKLAADGAGGMTLDPAKLAKAAYAYNHAQWYVKMILYGMELFKCTEIVAADSLDSSGLQSAVNQMKSQKIVYQSGNTWSAKWSETYLASIEVPYWTGKEQKTMTIKANRAIADNLKSAFAELAGRKFPVFSVECWGTSQGVTTGERNLPSAHLFGLACDINSSVNPFYAKTGPPPNPNTPGAITDEIANIFRKYGFYWGGNWTVGKDYMHFTINNGQLEGMLK